MHRFSERPWHKFMQWISHAMLWNLSVVDDQNDGAKILLFLMLHQHTRDRHSMPRVYFLSKDSFPLDLVITFSASPILKRKATLLVLMLYHHTGNQHSMPRA